VNDEQIVNKVECKDQPQQLSIAFVVVVVD